MPNIRKKHLEKSGFTPDTTLLVTIGERLVNKVAIFVTSIFILGNLPSFSSFSCSQSHQSYKSK